MHWPPAIFASPPVIAKSRSGMNRNRDSRSDTIRPLSTTHFRLLAQDINSSIYEYEQLIKGKNYN